MRSLVSIVLTVAAFVVIFHYFYFDDVIDLLQGIPFFVLFEALFLIIVNQILSCVRFYVFMTDLGANISFSRAFRTNIYSVVGGLLLFNLLGQSLVRSAFLRDVERSPAFAFFVTSLERIVALALLIIFAIAGSLILFSRVSLSLELGGSLVTLITCGVAVAAASFTFGVNRRYRRILRNLIFDKLLKIVMRIGLVSIVMHATMLAAYVILAVHLSPGSSIVDLAAVSAIVMLAAALPISFAGWGIREFSAAFAFSALDLQPESGIAMALAIGGISLAALLINSVFAVLTQRWQAPPKSPRDEGALSAISFVRLLGMGLPSATAAFVLFQVPVPMSDGALINFNLADPVALIGAVILVALAIHSGLGWHLLRVPGLAVALVAATAVTTIGFFHGWISFGLTDWALYNRFVGWFVLLSYVATGILVTLVAGRIGISMVNRVFVVAAAAVFATEYWMRIGSKLFNVELAPFVGPNFSGMLGNPNAFGFSMVLALAVALPAPRMWVRYPWLEAVCLGFVLSGLWYSGSRAAYVSFICIVLAYAALKKLNIKQLAKSIGMAAVITVVLPTLISSLFPQTLGSDVVRLPASIQTTDRILTIQTDRSVSIFGGLDVWADSPIFGRGLGYFMHSMIEKTGEPLVIHNSFVWLAAEYGTLGLIIFLAIPVCIIWYFSYDRLWVSDRSATVVLGLLVGIAVACLVHDMAYQRAFWLLLGAACATPRGIARQTRQPSNPEHLPFDRPTEIGLSSGVDRELPHVAFANPPRQCLASAGRDIDRRPGRTRSRSSLHLANSPFPA